MIASFAKANGVDLFPENQYALQRLANWVLQHDNRNTDWLVPYCTLAKCDSVTISLRDSSSPQKNRRMGGDLTVLYQP
jgi:poly(beta-D-mannuronate) lyase